MPFLLLWLHVWDQVSNIVFLVRIALDIQGLLCFPVNATFVFCVFVRNDIWFFKRGLHWICKLLLLVILVIFKILIPQCMSMKRHWIFQVSSSVFLWLFKILIVVVFCFLSWISFNVVCRCYYYIVIQMGLFLWFLFLCGWGLVQFSVLLSLAHPVLDGCVPQMLCISAYKRRESRWNQAEATYACCLLRVFKMPHGTHTPFYWPEVWDMD